MLVEAVAPMIFTLNGLGRRENFMKCHLKKAVINVRIIAMIFALFYSTTIVAYAENPSKTLESGSTWTVTDKYAINGSLVIKDGAAIKSQDGYLLTMTVDGVETPIKAGSYKGNIIITPTQKIANALYNGSMVKGANTDYRTGLFIDAGQIIEKSSVTSALVGGRYNNKSASDIKIASNNNIFNGLIINDSDYTVSNVSMTANGSGGNDFIGYGAGIAVTGKSRVDIDNFNFIAMGPLRYGIYAGGEFEKENLTVTIKNSFLKTDGSIGEIPSGVMMTSVPWVLGIDSYGHVRTQMVDGYANVTYKKTTLLSDGWGVLSTDDTSVPAKYGDYSITLKAEDSIVDITGTSGYGSYAIGACHNIFSNTVMGNTKYSSVKYGLTYALIVANEYAGGEFLNGTNVTSKYGVMYHKNQTGITRVDNSTFNTYGANFLIKHCYPVINVSNSRLRSENGVIVQLMSTDDPGFTSICYIEALNGASAAKDEKHDIYRINKTNTKIFTTELKDVVLDAQASFSKMEINGDFYNSVSGVDDDDLHLLGQNLVLTFNDVKLTGVISSSTALHKNYSYYLSSKVDDEGNKIAVNKDGYQLDGKWEMKKSMFGGELKKVFTPTIDAKGSYIIVGKDKHYLYEGVIISKDATYLGNLVNTPSPAVNNGVIVSLTDGTVWTVTNKSYLTSLTIDNSSIIAPKGYNVDMTVNGIKTIIKTGETYIGNIVLSLSKSD
jgi:hypothetical protein